MSSGDAQPALLNAFLLTTKDALMVFEAARRGICPVVTRRLHESEKAKMITSGSVFAFDEQATGIKRCELAQYRNVDVGALLTWACLHRDRWCAMES